MREGQFLKQTKRAANVLMARAITKQHRFLLIALTAGLIWTVAMTGNPLLVRSAVDKGIVAKNLHLTLVFSVLIILVGSIQGICSAIRRYSAFKVTYDVETDLRRRLFNHLQRLHLSFHDAAQTGQLMSRAVSDLQQISNFTVNIPITISSALILIVSFTTMFILSAELALVVFIGTVVLMLLTRLFTFVTNSRSYLMQMALADMSGISEQSIVGIRVIKGFGVEKEVSDRALAAAKGIYERAIKLARLRSFYSPLQASISGLTYVVVILVGGLGVIHHQLQVGTLVAFLVYVNMLNVPLGLIAYSASIYPRANASAIRISEILNLPPIIKDPPKPKILPDKDGGRLVEFNNVSFSYASGSEFVFKGLNLRVEPGQFLAITGPTGCGKTTLAKLLLRFYDVNEGSICIDGIDIRELTLAQLRKQIGVVFEEAFLFSDTIMANIAFSEPNASFSSVKEAASLAMADEFIELLEDKYNTYLVERGLNLSGGQRQRIALARAILGNPKILLLDDPTSSVDPEKEQLIIDGIAKVARDRTTILIARNARMLALADKVAVLKDKAVLDIGTHRELLSRCPYYAELVGKFQHDKNVIKTF